MNYDQAVMHAKFQQYIERIILLQRIFKLRFIIKQHKTTASIKKSQEIIKASAGLKSLIIAIYKHKVQSQEEFLKKHELDQYKVLDEIRDNNDDAERVCTNKMEKLKEELAHDYH